MHCPHSGTLVIFGVTGELIYKKIFPSLYAMEWRRLQMPVIGAARPEWTLERFRVRARRSIERHGDFDEAVLGKPAGLRLRRVRYCREALRPRPTVRAGAERDAPHGLRRVVYLPHRHYPGKEAVQNLLVFRE